jgi:polysaccharide export outer membrane protein
MMLKNLSVLSLLLLAAGARAASSAPRQEPQTPTSQPDAPQEKPELPDWSMDYAIQPGDVIHIVVWKEDALTGDHTVRLDGNVTIPLLGDIKASGRLPRDLAKDISEALKIFIERPIVTVGILTANNARFFVIGKVMISGTFPMFGRTSVVQGLALAGGFQEFAKKSRIRILRFSGDARQQVSIPFNFDDIESGLNLEQNIVLLPGDTIIVP